MLIRFMKTLFILSLVLTVHLTSAAILPPDATVCGKTQAEMSAEWWRYNFSLSTNVAVASDVTNRYHLPAGPLDPSCPVYYLASRGFAPPPQEPIFTIPEDAYIFFPIQSVFWDNVDVIPPCTVQQLRDKAASLMDLMVEARLTIDGVFFPGFLDHRQLAPIFSFEFTTPDNIYSSQFIGRPFTGLIDPMIADGYYVLLQLPIGLHALSVGATFADPINLSYDLPAYINIVPLSLEQKVERLLAQVQGADISTKRKQALQRTLLRVGEVFETEHLRAGIRQLRAFQQQVRAQLQRSNPQLAQQLIADAQEIIDRARQQLILRGSHDDDGEEDEDD